jgi:F-type H+-transporting ATPase subunit b
MEMLNTLGVDWSVLIAQAINFAVLLAALTYLLYKPILRMIDERRERVKQSMDHAATLEKRVSEMEQDRKNRMKEIDDQSKEFLLQAKQQADGMKKEILDAAKVEVDHLLEKGRKQLDDERRTLLADMQKTVTNVGVELAGKILSREFTDADQKRILHTLEKEIPSLIQK